MTGSLQTLSERLHDIQSNYALKMLAVVGMDGLLIDSASSNGFDAEMIAAVAAPGLLMMSDLANEIGEQLPQMTTLEFNQHVVAMLPLSDDTLLVAIAEAGAMNLGQIRIVLRRSMDSLRGALSEV
jgi:predicted regulator of Ras-like GTPase activity (Roadblock/LC7/MglB family)